jgi:uncharacterized protein (TIGR02246 family)
MTERRTAFLGLVGLLAACQPEPPAAAPLADVSAEIRAVGATFGAAMNAGDAAGIANLYTADAQLLPPNAPTVTGRTDIEAVWRGLIDATHPRVTLTTVEAVGGDSLAVEIGHYVLADSTGAAFDEGKYIVWWKRTADGWRMHRDIWNSDRPAAGSAAVPAPEGR